MCTCAIKISPNCKQDLKRSGICRECLKYLIDEKFIISNKYSDYPEWLLELLRSEQRLDKEFNRHPVEVFEDSKNSNKVQAYGGCE